MGAVHGRIDHARAAEQSEWKELIKPMPVVISQSTFVFLMLALRCTAVDWILITAYCFALPMTGSK